MPNINFCVKNDICCGCGICEDVCPSKAILIEEKKQLFLPKIAEDCCRSSKGCDLCSRVCPGLGINLQEFSDKFYKTEFSKFDEYIGHYTQCYAAWSTDQEIRLNSSSGGVLSQFLIYLLEKKIIDGAVVTRFSDNNPLRTCSFIATNKEEILSGKTSKYCPVSLNKIIGKIKNFSGKVVVVDLPCHIQGFRKYLKLNTKLNEKIIGLFGLYCSSNRNFGAIDALLKKK